MSTAEAAHDAGPFDALIAHASARPERVLLESEGMTLLEMLGFAVPRREVVADADAIARWTTSPFEGERVVLKALSPQILHKTDAHAVAVLPNRVAALHEAASEMETRLAGRGVVLATEADRQQGEDAKLQSHARASVTAARRTCHGRVAPSRTARTRAESSSGDNGVGGGDSAGAAWADGGGSGRLAAVAYALASASP